MPIINSVIKGGGSAPTLITKSITSNGTYNASSDNADGYSSVTVSVPGGGYQELPNYQVVSGVASRRSRVLDGTEFSGITSISGQGFYYSFYKRVDITGSVSFPALLSVGTEGLYYAFSGCTGITSASFSSLTTIGSSGLSNIFRDCTALTNVSFDSLSTIDSSGLNSAFYGCKALTDVYFYSLTTTSFGSYTNQFRYMLSNTGTNITHKIHFPSNLSSTISGLTDYPLFGGGSGYVTLVFDLPQTS